MTSTEFTSKLEPCDAHRIALQFNRADFEALPPATRQQTLERIRERLLAEKRRGQRSHSALWHQALPVYGIDPDRP